MPRRLALGLGVLGLAAGTAVLATRTAAADAGNADAVELGRRLFFDPALGRRGRVGCAECHQPEHGFSDPRDRSRDEDRTLPRHSQPVTDLAGAGFHWDGEFDTVRELIDSRTLPVADASKANGARATRRLEAARAAGNVAKDADVDMSGSYGGGSGTATPLVDLLLRTTPVAARLAEDGRYDDGFRRAFGDATITPRRVGDAVEAYLRSVRTSENALDRRLRGEVATLPPAAERGLELFRGRAGCANCHVLDTSDGRASLTDGQFHNTGVATAAVSAERTLVNVTRHAIVKRGTDLGHHAATLDEDDIGSFKTPSLRDVARRAPYMHDASLRTLRAVVDYYDGGGTPNAHLDRRIRKLDLDESEKDDLVAFLESLTGETRAGVGPLTPAHVATLRVHVEALDGTPVAGLPLDVEPCGDRLGDDAATPKVARVFTDAAGDADIAFPTTTHVRVGAAGYELGLSRPIPDWVSRTTLVATPRDRVSVRVRRGGALGELPSKIQLRPAGGALTMRKGCMCVADEDSAPFEMDLVRRLSDDEGLYAAAAPTDARLARPLGSLSLSVDGGDEPLGVFEFDLSGGASETVDLGRAERVSEFDFHLIGRSRTK